jgi:hypothetical protein
VSTPDTLAAELERLVRVEQPHQRLASITAAVLRDGELVWETAVGAAEVRAQREATPDTQYRVGVQLVLSWRKGTLEARLPGDPDWKEPAVFQREAEDRWRIVSGWEHGDLLRVEADRLVLAGYPVTREPQLWA